MHPDFRRVARNEFGDLEEPGVNCGLDNLLDERRVFGFKDQEEADRFTRSVFALRLGHLDHSMLQEGTNRPAAQASGDGDEGGGGILGLDYLRFVWSCQS